MTASGRTAAASPPTADAPGLNWLGLVLLTLCGALAGLLEVLLVPFYAGSVVVPVAVVLGALTNYVLPRLTRHLMPRAGAAAAPFVSWLATVLTLAMVDRPEGDVLLPGGDLQWVSYGLLLVGGVVGVFSVILHGATSTRPRSR